MFGTIRYTDIYNEYLYSDTRVLLQVKENSIVHFNVIIIYVELYIPYYNYISRREKLMSIL